MEQIKTHWYARPLSVYLSLCVALTSVFLTLAAPQTVQAQQAARAPYWAVLDFDNETNYGGADIGREAGDALVLELGRTDRFNVITRSTVNDGLDQLGLRPPLDPVDIQKLGRQINADAIITGSVLAVTKKTNPSQIDAVVAVRVIDTQSGELINGALAEGLSTPRDGASPDEDVLVNEAISKAAFAAVKQIISYNLPEPTILNNEGPDTVLLNMGSRDGVAPGQKYLVRRDGVEVGRLEISAVEADESTANVTQKTLGIRPGDHARAIYALPPYDVRGGHVITDTSSLSTGSAAQATKHNAFSSAGGVILAILAAAVLVGFINRGSGDNSLGGAGVGSAGAQAVYGNEVSLPISTNLVLGEENPNSYGVRIQWSTGNLNPRTIVAFNIYRGGNTALSTYDGQVATTSGTTTSTTTAGTTTAGTIFYIFNQGPALSVGNSQRSVIDTGQERPDVTFPFVTFPIVSETNTTGGTGTTGTTSSTSSSTTSSTSTTGTTGTTSSTSSSSSTTSGNSGSGSLPQVQINQIGTIVAGEVVVPQLPIGVPTTYSVTAVYQAQSNFGSTQTIGYEETPVQQSVSGLVTPVLPVDTTSTVNGLAINTIPASYLLNPSSHKVNPANLTSIVFSFRTELGADTYVVDVSNTSNFARKLVLSPDPISADATGTDQVSTTLINLKTGFPGTTKFYYRIGDRFSGDNPGPIINNAINPNSDTYGNKNASYIYSTVNYFVGA